MSYYEKRFKQLIDAGVPKDFIRLQLLEDLKFFSSLYIYKGKEDTNGGWYATNGISIAARTGNKNVEFYGEIASLGFPTWDEYKLLFEGDEAETIRGFMYLFEEHKEYWIGEVVREEERNISYV